MKDCERALESSHETIILLETRISQLQGMENYAHKYRKKVFVHADLIHGLRADKYGVEFLVNNVKVDG